MDNIILLITLLLTPFFIINTPSYRHGIMLGLFVSTIFLCKYNLFLLLIPLGTAIYLYKSRFQKIKSPPLRFSSAVMPLLLVFLGSLSMVLAFSPATNFTVSKEALGLSNFGLLVGGIYFGAKVDEKGVLYPSIFLCLLSELSLLFILKGADVKSIYLIGKFFFSFCQSGFFVIFPKIVFLLFGQKKFYKFYIFLGIWVFAFNILSRELGLSSLEEPNKFYNYLYALVLLGCIGALFIFLVWKRRLFLIVES